MMINYYTFSHFVQDICIIILINIILFYIEYFREIIIVYRTKTQRRDIYYLINWILLFDADKIR